MSDHKIEVIRLDEILPHDNADKLEIAVVWGYTCVVAKGQFEAGDLAAYVLPDSLVDVSVPEFSFLLPKAKPDGKYRVRGAAFRGVKSQGLLIPARKGWKVGDDVSDELKIEHYEPAVSAAQVSGKAERTPLINGVAATEYTDIQNFRRHHTAFDEIKQEVVITEKIHGCVSGDTVLQTKEYGPLPISEIVDKNLPCSVLSADIFTNEDSFEVVTGWSRMSTGEFKWYEILLEDGTTLPLRVTGNHLVFLPNIGDYVVTSSLVVGEPVRTGKEMTMKIVSIKQIAAPSDRYDVEVAHNHNFYANGVLVHNSNFRAVHDGKRLHVGSHHQWKRMNANQFHKFLVNLSQASFYRRLLKFVFGQGVFDSLAIGNDNFSVLARSLDLEAKLAKFSNYVFYGEIYGIVQKGYPYDSTATEPLKVRFFDVKNKDQYLDYDFAKPAVLSLGLEWVPELYRGPWDKDKALALAEGKTTLGGKHIREGCVVKPVRESTHPKLGRLTLKVVGQGYLTSDE
jgi:hypothetical protein